MSDKNHIFQDELNKSLCGLLKVHIGSLGQYAAEFGYEGLKDKPFICKNCLGILKKKEKKMKCKKHKTDILVETCPTCLISLKNENEQLKEAIRIENEVNDKIRAENKDLKAFAVEVGNFTFRQIEENVEDGKVKDLLQELVQTGRKLSKS